MTFQFQCPAGHLLSGDPAQAGQQCTCPLCGTVFIIPAPLPTTPPPATPSAATQPPFPGAPPAAPQPPSSPSLPSAPAPSPEPPPPPAAPGDASFSFSSFAPAAVEISPAPATTTKKEERLLHIPCPNGHELECPPDMLGQDVLCPECNSQFTLREKDSEEYKRRKQRERERKEKKLADAWFNFAVIVGVLVVVGIVALAGAVWFGEPPEIESIQRRPPPTFGAPKDPSLESNPDLETNPGSNPESNPGAASESSEERPSPTGD